MRNGIGFFCQQKTKLCTVKIITKFLILTTTVLNNCDMNVDSTYPLPKFCLLQVFQNPNMVPGHTP